MKSVNLSGLAAPAEVMAAVISCETAEASWTDRMAAGEKQGKVKSGITNAELWTGALPANAKKGCKPIKSPDA